MSLQSAEEFIIDYCSQNSDENLKNIMKNIDSKFESKDTKFHYICEKAKELGYNFNSKELLIAFKTSRNKLNESSLLGISGKIEGYNSPKEALNKAKKFWDSLW